MQIQPLDIPDVKLIKPKRFGDSRGFFMETFSAPRLAEHGIKRDWVQDNHSLSAKPGVLRGLHFQAPPHAQAKLVRVVKGRVWDVAVDVRVGSPTFGKWVSAELSANNDQQLFIPEGFAHGFVTLEPDTEFLYKVSSAYAPEADGGVRWDDPQLDLPWPLDGIEGGPQLSDKDAALPALAELDSPFVYSHMEGAV
ncbi:MAG: dTDP-4-dehydrorhamnose 3,5-epimerase [Planctomycetota bacterium]